MKLPAWVLVPLTLVACTGTLPEAQVPTNAQGAIYNGDTREDVSTSSSPEKDLVKATAVLVDDYRLTSIEDSQKFQLKSTALEQLYPLCPDEKFLTQPTLGFCSGTLIAPNLVLTAGHCVEDEKTCSQTHFIFGWTEEKSRQKTLPASEVYHCKRLVKFDLNIRKNIDYAILELDRPVLGVRPVAIAKESLLQPNEKLLSLSHPLGLPVKKDTATVLSDSTMMHTFKVQVDTFSGSSGSPLYNAQGEIVGILSRGMDDILEDDIYRVQKEGGCINFNTCAVGLCFGQTYYKAPRIDL